MQDEVNEKVVSLAIKTSKLTAEVLQKAMKALLAKGKGQLTKAPHGKITMRQLMKPGEKVSNIEITDQNIKAFDPITKHPNYKYLSDYDKKNTFDMEKHLRRRPALVKSDEIFDYYEISESDLQEDTDHE